MKSKVAQREGESVLPVLVAQSGKELVEDGRIFLLREASRGLQRHDRISGG